MGTTPEHHKFANEHIAALNVRLSRHNSQVRAQTPDQLGPQRWCLFGGAGRAVVNGVTTELAGKVVQARLRFAGQADYTDGATRRVSDNETFTWKRRTNRKLYVYFTTEDRTVRSNGLIIKP